MNRKKYIITRSFFILILILIINEKLVAQNISKSQDRSKKIQKSIGDALKNFRVDDVSLFGSFDLTKQNINDNGITAPINYLYNSVNNNYFKPGYSAGIRIDGLYKEKHFYTFSIALNQIGVGSLYQNRHTLSPYLNDYTHFKADNSFTSISFAAHYKKLFPLNELKKYKFYIVAGPSLEYKISTISNENSINGAGNRAIINGDLGAEFDNNGYYLLFAHYKLGTYLFQSSAPTQFNRFDIGVSLKVKDLF